MKVTIVPHNDSAKKRAPLGYDFLAFVRHCETQKEIKWN